MKNTIIKFLTFPWRFLAGLLIMIFTVFGLFIIVFSMPIVFGLSLAIGWKILLGIGYVYLFSLWIVCIMNIDNVLYFALDLICRDFIN